MNYTTERIWTTKAGYRAVVIVGGFDGHRCGYVGITKEHPLYGKNYSEHLDVLKPLYEKAMAGEIGKRGILAAFCATSGKASMDIAFDVHGSVTFAGGDGKYPIEGPEWWVGFDCAHSGDNDSRDPSSFRSLEYCQQECENLADQLKSVGG